MRKDSAAKGAAADTKWRFEAVPDHEDGTRLDRFLRRLFPRLGQGQIERMLRNGLIRLDGAKAKAATRLATGQTLRLPPVIAESPAASKPAAPRIVASSSLDHDIFTHCHIPPCLITQKPAPNAKSDNSTDAAT